MSTVDTSLGSPASMTSTTSSISLSPPPSSCSSQTGSYWNCFYPKSPSACTSDCKKEMYRWLASSRGLLTDLESLGNDKLSIRPHRGDDYDVDVTGGSGSIDRIQKTASLTIPIPNVYLKIQVPGYYLKSDLQNFQDRYYTHIIELQRYNNDEQKWHVHPLPPSRDKAFILNKDGFAKFLADVFSRDPANSLEIHLKIPREIIRESFGSNEQIAKWWALFQDVKIEKNGVPWLPPNPLIKDETKGNNLFRDEFIFFQADDRKTPFHWKLALSSRHLLLFWLLKASEESPLTKPMAKAATIYSYPDEVASFIRNWRLTTQRSF